MSNQIEEIEEQEDDNNPYSEILYGVGALVAAYLVYNYFTGIELSGEVAAGHRKTAIIRLVYNLGGKWLPTGIFGLVGLGFLAFGIKGFIKPK
jgi:hypothetical protein